MAAKLARALNLKPHTVGQRKETDRTFSKISLDLACDAELHRGKIDGRIYIVDVARLMPPEPPMHHDQDQERGSGRERCNDDDDDRISIQYP